MRITKTIFWISTIYDIHNRQSFFTTKFIKFLNEESEVVIFTPERLSKQNLPGLECNKIVSIMRLPEFCRAASDYIIIYNIEDAVNCNLITHYIKQYPGIVLLHDLSLFNLEISKYSHGSVDSELSHIFQESYGTSAALAGSQYVLNKSVEIYSYLYDFLGQVFNETCDVFVFSKEAQCYLASKGYNSTVISFPLIKNDGVSIKDKSLEIVVLFHIRTRLSKVGQDLLALSHCDEQFSCCLLRVKVEERKFHLEISLDEPINSVTNFLQNKNISLVVEVGNSPLMGIGVFTLASIELGIPVMIEESIEAKMLNLGSNCLYEKSESLTQILAKFNNQSLANQTSWSIDYRGLARNLFMLINEKLSSIQMHTLFKTRGRMSMLTTTKNTILNSVKDNCDFDMLSENCYSNAVNDSFCNFLKINE